MASAIRELQYRTVDQMLDAAKLDLQSYQQAGNMDIAPLIKLAQAINYELGLRIYQPKQTILEIEHNRAKLPADFHQLQLALLTYSYRVLSTAPWNGNVWLEQVIKSDTPNQCDLCQVVHEGQCPVVVANPYVYNGVRTICDGAVAVKVLKFCESTVHCFESFERMYIKPARNAGGFCVNEQFKGCTSTGQIVGSFLETNVNCGSVYVTYLGAMEDDEGNLLVLDHPKINLYYEWSMKVAVLENLYLNGEPDIERRLHYANDKLDQIRQQALSIANTSDYRQCINAAQVNRGMNSRRYVNILAGWKGYLGYANQVDNIRVI